MKTIRIYYNPIEDDLLCTDLNWDVVSDINDDIENLYEKMLENVLHAYEQSNTITLNYYDNDGVFVDCNNEEVFKEINTLYDDFYWKCIDIMNDYIDEYEEAC